MIQKIFGAILLCLVAGVATASAQTEHCFYNGGLKIQQVISFTLTKNKIEGTLESGGYQKDTSAETFDFTGTKTGNLLKIRFDGKPPYELPPHTKQIVWMLNVRMLKVPTYGRNYNTGKYSTYAANYTPCKKNPWIWKDQE